MCGWGLYVSMTVVDALVKDGGCLVVIMGGGWVRAMAAGGGDARGVAAGAGGGSAVVAGTKVPEVAGLAAGARGFFCKACSAARSSASWAVWSARRSASWAVCVEALALAVLSFLFRDAFSFRYLSATSWWTRSIVCESGPHASSPSSSWPDAGTPKRTGRVRTRGPLTGVNAGGSGIRLAAAASCSACNFSACNSS